MKLYQINKYTNNLSELNTNYFGNYTHPFLDFINKDNVKSRFQFKIEATNEPTLLREPSNNSINLGPNSIEYNRSDAEIIWAHQSLSLFNGNYYTIRGSFFDDKFDVCNKSPEQFIYDRDIYTNNLPLDRQLVYKRISTPINQVTFSTDFLMERFDRMNIYFDIYSWNLPVNNYGYILSLRINENSNLCEESSNNTSYWNQILLRKLKIRKVNNSIVSLLGVTPQNLPFHTSVRNHMSGYDTSRRKVFFTPTVYSKYVCLYEYSICDSITNTCGSKESYLQLEEQYLVCNHKPKGIQISSHEYLKVFKIRRQFEKLWRWDSFDIENTPSIPISIPVL